MYGLTIGIIYKHVFLNLHYSILGGKQVELQHHKNLMIDYLSNISRNIICYIFSYLILTKHDVLHFLRFHLLNS